MRVGLIVPPGFALMSLAPLSVFEVANERARKPLYEIHLLSEEGGRIPNAFGMDIWTRELEAERFDTVLLGSGSSASPASPRLVRFLRDAAEHTRRIASISVGAFALAEAGILDGRRATTLGLLARASDTLPGREGGDRPPLLDKTESEIDAGRHAGACPDRAIGDEEDTGADIAREVARTLVVHHRRAGGQSQHSALLELDAKSDRVQRVLAFARRHLREELTIGRLADIAHLSPRQFSRVFRRETGQSPARAIEILRCEAAQLMLEQGRLPIAEIARAAGFGGRERMRRSFIRAVGETPRAIRNASEPIVCL